MHAFVLIDPAGEWTVLRSKGRERGQGDHDPTVSGEFCLLLTDSSHSVRMFMASAITWLVTNVASNTFVDVAHALRNLH